MAEHRRSRIETMDNYVRTASEKLLGMVRAPYRTKGKGSEPTLQANELRDEQSEGVRYHTARVLIVVFIEEAPSAAMLGPQSSPGSDDLRHPSTEIRMSIKTFHALHWLRDLPYPGTLLLRTCPESWWLLVLYSLLHRSLDLDVRFSIPVVEVLRRADHVSSGDQKHTVMSTCTNTGACPFYSHCGRWVWRLRASNPGL